MTCQMSVQEAASIIRYQHYTWTQVIAVLEYLTI